MVTRHHWLASPNTFGRGQHVKKELLLNVALNLVLMIVFGAMNRWALQKQFEETFVMLVLIYGCVVIVVNGLFVSWQKAV